ncbi:MAG: AAA family ATPase [Enhygromyxa sp.]
MAFGVELASLLTELHARQVHGVRFTREMLRIEDGHIGLDGFTHLLHSDRKLTVEVAAPRDLAALVELLRTLGEDQVELSLGSPSTAAELHERLVDLGEAPKLPELPPDPPFVGRSRALAELDRGLDQAQIAQPTALVVRGQRGVGKSRLMSEFVAARLTAGDAIVLAGAWQEHSADSRGGLSSALEQLPQALAGLELDERDDIRRRINRATRHLGAIVTRSAPSLGAVLRNVEELPPLELGEDFSRHTAVIADLLRSIGTQKRPLVLVLDNLESIDASSSAVLKILTQSRPAHHTLVVMGLRTGAGHEPDFEVQAIDLAPLTDAELERMLVEALPGGIADAKALSDTLWAVSNGLPLAAWTNLRAWIDRGRLSRGLDDGVWRVRGHLRDEGGRLEVYDVFGARLTAAAPAVRELALHLAVIGVEIGSTELAALGEHDDAVADLVDRGILTRTPSGVRFPHDSIREFVLESFDEQQRRDAHAHAADLLTRQKAPVAQIAYHRDLALDPAASPEAFDRLSRLHVEAGRERLAVYDLERARWHLERALEHSRDPEQRSIAAEGLADICLLLDDVDAAVSLYTALIATSEPARAVATAAKAVAFLWSKSASSEARQLGHMALEVVGEPTPTSSLGKLGTLLGAVFRSWLGREPKLGVDVREPLCRLYPWLTLISLIDDPIAMPMYVARSHWIAKGLESGATSIIGSVQGSVWAALGFFNKANKLFARAYEIALKANDAWAQGWAKHHWGHVSLLPADRYEDGQDMLDDAIAAFRETGDVSIAILAIMFKGLYGRDREPADVVLGWFEEASATARRNGKFVASAPLEALKLHVMARQGRTDLESRISALAAHLDAAEMSGIERLMARVYLAFAAYESKQWNIAVAQVRAGQAQLGDLPGVPEYCSEIHLVTALVMLERPTPTANDRKLLRHATRKFRGAAKRSPRLRVLGDFLEFVLAQHHGSAAKARVIASKIVADFENHENLYVAREAHRVLSRLLKGENVLAAAEHDRVARNLGRRLGLQERALLSEFSDVEDEVGMLALSIESSLKLDESQHDIPAAGMLTSAVQPRRKTDIPADDALDEQADVLEAWALTSTSPKHTILGEIFSPIRAAVDGSIDQSLLTIDCPEPELEVPVSSGDLQIVLINLLLTCSDAAGRSVPIEIRLGSEVIVAGRSAAPHDDTSNDSSTPSPGRYLSVRVSAPSPADRVPILSAFSNCERLVRSIGGHLSAATTRERILLTARVPLEEVVTTAVAGTR